MNPSRHLGGEAIQDSHFSSCPKVVPDAFGKGRVGVVVHPVGLALRNRALAS